MGAAWIVTGSVLLVLSASLDDRPEAEAGVPAMLVTVLGAGALLYGSVILVSAWRKIRHDERLKVEGLPADATVTAIERTRDLRINNERLWVIRYRYQDHNGRPQSGESGPLFRYEAEGWEVGATATVRYDPHSPQLSTWIGRPGSAGPR